MIIGGGTILKDMILRPIDDNERRLRVCDQGTPSGDWDMSRVSNLLPKEVRDCILRMRPPKLDGSSDSVAWRLIGDGGFSNSSTCKVLLDPTLRSNSRLFKKIWSWAGAERGRVHMWRCGHEALATNTVRWRLGVATSNQCPTCNSREESTIYLLRDCAFAKNMWWAPEDGVLPNQFSNADLQQWMIMNIDDHLKRGGVPWSTIFGVAIQHLWQLRNEPMFQGVPPNLNKSLIQIKRYAEAV